MGGFGGFQSNMVRQQPQGEQVTSTGEVKQQAVFRTASASHAGRVQAQPTNTVVRTASAPYAAHGYGQPVGFFGHGTPVRYVSAAPVQAAPAADADAEEGEAAEEGEEDADATSDVEVEED